jgi:hypothetical protein
MTNTEALKRIIETGDLEKLRWFALACAHALDQIAALPGNPVVVPVLSNFSQSTPK